MIPTFGLDGWEHWLTDVDQAGGAVIALVDALPGDKDLLPGARGGFVSTI
ncbi:hypothetical protein LWC34_40180 [Kibdelosporangium philippinense]|uniref:Uncharacterized protein n=1 Tax=Kibdelosporangium philippinense TaxID=211113 RepID=A0ABS8ZML6_9PSEU|nr:hypothetical protein [Kibdelosporangium philippinense]MCE7008989.1 hypothetical protein [Kibdelosporangium philippinense]